MNKSKYALALTIAIAGIISTGCNSAEKKEEAAKEEVNEAKQELKEVQEDANAEAQKIASAEEWAAFKTETEVKINDNETKIAELRVKLKKPGKILDPHYANRIETLKAKNEELKKRIIDYETNQSDWEKFKREFNHDMDELGSALKDFSVDNKK